LGQILYFSRKFLPSTLLWLLCAVHPATALDAPPSPVTLTEVTTATLRQEVRLTGTSIPWRMVPLSPRVEGLASRVLVDEGTWVQPGQPILELDPRLAEIEIEVAKARVEGAKARLRDAIRKRDELRKLEKRQHASQTAIASSVAEVEMATAAVTQERAELERFRELRQRHSVSAPFAGMVVSKQVEVGQWVKQDSSVIELVAMDTLRVQAPLPQLYYPQVAVGSRARVFFDAFPDREFEGNVYARVALANEASRSFPLLIDIPNPDHLLAPGMSARILVELGDERPEVLMISRDAVVTRSNGSRIVWRVLEDEGILKAHPVDIETGRAQDEHLEVVDGKLQAGDRIVLLGNENLRPGQAVRAHTEQPTVAIE
jgi:RND family efflux transporter MFP subunit